MSYLIKKRVSFCLLPILFLAINSAILAQQKNPVQDEPASGQSSESQTEIKTTPLEKGSESAQSSKNKAPKEVFRPSEEISEDSPVPFPVDI